MSSVSSGPGRGADRGGRCRLRYRLHPRREEGVGSSVMLWAVMPSAPHVLASDLASRRIPSPSDASAVYSAPPADAIKGTSTTNVPRFAAKASCVCGQGRSPLAAGDHTPRPTRPGSGRSGDEACTPPSGSPPKQRDRVTRHRGPFDLPAGQAGGDSVGDAGADDQRSSSHVGQSSVALSDHSGSRFP